MCVATLHVGFYRYGPAIAIVYVKKVTRCLDAIRVAGRGRDPAPRRAEHSPPYDSLVSGRRAQSDRYER
jgi:hypothetical protein